MKKTIVMVILFIASCMFISSIVMFFYCKKVENRLDTAIKEGMPLKGENIISIVDTIYGRKYVIDVDTITGRAKIIGFRHNPIIIEDSIH